MKGNRIWLAEAGSGDPVLYLHGFADLHSASTGLFPFHEKLGKNFRLMAPAHPACSESDEREDIDTIDDLELPSILKDVSLTKRGMVLCVGGTGTGIQPDIGGILYESGQLFVGPGGPYQTLTVNPGETTLVQ